jgi:hypothetical protein
MAGGFIEQFAHPLRWSARQYSKRIVNINVNIIIASSVAVTLTVVVVHFSRYFGVKDEHKLTIQIITFVADWVIDLVVAVGLHWVSNHWPARWKRGAQIMDRVDQVLDSTPPPGLSIMKDAAAGALIPRPLSMVVGGGESEKQIGGEPGTVGGATATSTEGSELRAGNADVGASNGSSAGVGHHAGRAAGSSVTGAGGHEPVNGSTNAKRQVSFIRDATTIQLQRLCLSPLFYFIAWYGQSWMLVWKFPRELTVAVPFALAIVITRLIHTYWMIKTDPIVFEEWAEATQRRHASHARQHPHRHG